MAKTSVSFSQYEGEVRKERYAQFRENDFTRGSFVIGALDAGVLVRRLGVRAEGLPGYGRSDALIVTRKRGHKELWLNPHLTDYRGAHLAFFEVLGVSVPSSIAGSYDSDHAYPKSAAHPEVGLVMMSFIKAGTNRSFGGGWEKRLSHRIFDGNGLAGGTLIDLFKSMGGRLTDQKNLPGSILAIPQMLVAAGMAPAGDLPKLLVKAQEALAHWQHQDEAYAIRTGQY